ncbi:MAG: carbohydrate kinase family protein [Anaerolineaceae bacterium]|jgi:ribokinase|nr:carbohydrate kinase family protein [Anaerolineaceae bacterium]
MESSAPILRYIIAGKYTRDYLILPNGQSYIDIQGGSGFYAAAGLGLWDNNIGLLGIVNEEYPMEWLQDAGRRGFDHRGIQIVPYYFDQRNFVAYPTLDHPDDANPISHFSRIGEPFPKTLLGYSRVDNPNPKNNLSSVVVKIKDIPFDYLDVTAVHICAMDYPSQSRLPSFFRQGHTTTISLMAANDYMNPLYGDLVPTILKDISAFICTEEQLRNLFYGRTSDLWEMVAELDVYGCELIVIVTKKNIFLLWDRTSQKKYEIPLYPSTIINPTGMLDSFCGGFLAGLRSTQNPIDAVLKGSISASFSVEGIGPFYCLDSLPQLVEARLGYLSPYVAEI